MKNLETKLPADSAAKADSGVAFAERQLLESYMPVGPESAYDCQTCNNCGSGDCASCCASSDN